MERYLRAAGTVVALLVLQTTFIPFLSLGGVVPDLLLIWVVTFALVRGQMEGALGGFVVGLLEDLLTTQFFGLAALAKTLAGFGGGYFHNENKTSITLGTYRFLLILFLVSLLHNLVHAGIVLQGSEGLSLRVILETAFTSSLYTTVVAVLPMFAFSRRVRP
jgi:rod shape-determining protein MreD